MQYLSFIWNLSLFLMALGFIIFVHELGHFATAKWAGIKVRRFALGIGKPFLSWRKGMGLRLGDGTKEYEERLAKGQSDLGETEYALCNIPLGGYVSMLGQEDMDPTKISQDPRAYNNKPIWKRIVVVSAGVVMNLIFAVVFFIIAFMIGTKFPPAQVGDVAYQSPAMTATADLPGVEPGLRPGDQILSINGKAIKDFAELRVASALARGNQELAITVLRPAWGDEPQRTITFKTTPTADNELKLLQIGVAAASSVELISPRDAKTKDGAIIAEHLTQFNLKPGMSLTAVDDKPITAHWQYLLALREAHGKSLTLTFSSPDGSTQNITVQPESGMQFAQVATIPQFPDETESLPHLLGLVPALAARSVDDPDAPAHGIILEGDVIAAAADLTFPTFNQFVNAVGASEGPMTIDLLRDGQPMCVQVEPRRARAGVVGPKKLGLPLSMTGDLSNVIGRVLDDSPLASLNLPAGTRILKIGQHDIATFNDIRNALIHTGPGDIDITFAKPLLGGIVESATVSIDEKTHRAIASLPWADPIGAFHPLEEPIRTTNPFAAAGMGFEKTMLFLNQTYLTLVRLVEGTISPKHMSGPVGITSIGTKMADKGFTYLLYFMGLISVNLAVINFLPLPIVDGGLFIMLLIEKLRGKPLPLPIQSAITMAGVVMIAAVFLFVTYNDIARLING